jgi:hypothetical protein
VLASWQADVVAEHPDELVRGLIQSDGNRHVNRVRGRLDRTKHYEYLRYMFTNASEDISGSSQTPSTYSACTGPGPLSG